MQIDSVYYLSFCIALETFRGLSTQPHQIEIRFNNGNVFYFTTYSTNWLCIDTIFTSQSNSTEIELRSINATGASAAKLDNMKLMKLSSLRTRAFESRKYLRIYPNPVKDILYIDNIYKDISNIKLLNCMGENIATFNQSPINLNGFANGIYFIQIETEKGLYITKFFITN